MQTGCSVPLHSSPLDCGLTTKPSGSMKLYINIEPGLNRNATLITISDIYSHCTVPEHCDCVANPLNCSHKFYHEQDDKAYSMCGGTLIGSVRHHGRIPWDDDVDVLIHFNDREPAVKALTNFNPDFRYDQFRKDLGKLYSIKGKRIPRLKHTYPFIDVWFYIENRSDLKYASIDGKLSSMYPRYSMPKKYFFPLVRRPFHNLSLLSLCNPLKILEATNVNISKCVSQHYNHRLEKEHGKTVEIACEELKNNFPFVNVRALNKSHVIEYLEHNNTLLRQELMLEIC